MEFILIIAFVLFVSAILLFVGITPKQIFDEVESFIKTKNDKRQTISKRVSDVKKPKSKNVLSKFVSEVRHILIVSGKSARFPTVCIIAAIGFFFGVFFALAIKNLFLVPVFSIGFALFPFFYVKLFAWRYDTEISNNLETALSSITTSYMRGRNTIIRAIEENIPYLTAPVSTVFENFIFKAKLINSDCEAALEQMKIEIENDVFREWIDAVILCQQDHTLKSTLPPIVAKLSEIRIVSAELSVIIMQPLQVYFIMLATTILSPFLIYVLNKDWWITLTTTDFGRLLIAICLSCVFITIGFAVKLSKPIDFK